MKNQLPDQPSVPKAMSETDRVDHTELDESTSTTTHSGVMAESCLLNGTPPPCMVVIVGASGDLTARKIIPALYNLYRNNGLPKPFFAVGCARTDWTTEIFRDRMKAALKCADLFEPDRWEEFASFLYYHPIQYDDQASFESLALRLSELDQKFSTGGNKLFYLAIPPSLYQSHGKNAGTRRSFRRGRQRWKLGKDRGGKTIRPGSQDSH